MRMAPPSPATETATIPLMSSVTPDKAATTTPLMQKPYQHPPRPKEEPPAIRSGAAPPSNAFQEEDQFKGLSDEER